MTPDWRQFFPLKKPRPQQERALDDLCSAAMSGKRVFLAELGTGVGKSAVAVAFARWLDAYEQAPEGFAPGAVVLTAQKVLQDQYTRDFSFVRDLRSSTNYSCVRPEIGKTCAITSRVRKAFRMLSEESTKKVACYQCPYRIAKDAYARAEVGVTNYSYFLSESVYAGELPLRHLLVLDEAHNVEDEVRRWSSVSVSETDATGLGVVLPRFDEREDRAVAWLAGEYRDALRAKIARVSARLIKIVEAGSFSPALDKLSEENEELDKRLCQVNRIVERGGTVLFSGDREKGTVLFQPLDVSEISSEVLYSRADKVLLMTATVLDEKVFKRSAGLPAGSSFMSIPTPFSPKSFGVHLMPVGKMSRQGIEKSIESIPKAIRKVLSLHPKEKGIIHTANYAVARKVAEVKNPRLLVQLRASDREQIIKEHMSSALPTVIVSPGMTEGLDLRDDLGRFQVICKVPYPDMSDPVVKRKMDSDREWYAWRTVRALAQAMGRGVRSERDFTTTYILDECYVDMLDRWGHMFPVHLTADMALDEL